MGEMLGTGTVNGQLLLVVYNWQRVGIGIANECWEGNEIKPG